MKKVLILSVLVLALSLPPAIAAEAPSLNAQKAGEMLSMARRDVFEASMKLTDAQKNTFWELYSAFEKERTLVSQSALGLVESYMNKLSTNTDEQFVKMMTDSAANQRKLIDLRTKYAKAMAKQIAPQVGVRFYQIEDYLSTAARLDVLDNMPFLGGD